MGKKKAALSGQLTDIDLRHLGVFKTVVESGGLTAAEVPLNLANSTISNYLSDLEKRLDLILCERGRGGFRLTEQGKVVYQATVELMQSLDVFKQTVNLSHNRILGKLTLALAEHSVTLEQECLVRTLDGYTRQAPEVDVTIRTLSSDEVTAAVLNDTADIGITVLSNPQPELTSTPLFSETMQLYCGNTHPLFGKKGLTEPDIQQYPVVESARLVAGREPNQYARNWQRTVRAHGQEARLGLILTGHYLGYLPEHFVKQWHLTDRLMPLLPALLNYQNQYVLIRKPRKKSRVTVDLFCQCLADALR